jgi:hypothetical protein
MSLAFELAEADDRIDAVFTYVTSAVRSWASGAASTTCLQLGKIRQLPRLFAVRAERSLRSRPNSKRIGN